MQSILIQNFRIYKAVTGNVFGKVKNYNNNHISTKVPKRLPFLIFNLLPSITFDKIIGKFAGWIPSVTILSIYSYIQVYF